MIQTLIADSRIKKNPALNKTHNTIVINPLDTSQTIKLINKLSKGPIHIYDITHNSKHKANDIIKVSDHINKTGHNPLIGKQNRTEQPFIDISNLYNSTEGVTTDCLGKYFNDYKKQHEYPSQYLCYISIIAKALGRKNINAFLVNTL